MAERRMFSKSVVNSARFLKLPPSARLLYYDLGMAADDDGVVEAFVVLRTSGASQADLSALIGKGLVALLDEEDQIALILDWKKNNLVPKDRYRKGAYRELLERWQTDRAQADGEPLSERQQPDNEPLPEPQQPDNAPLPERQQPDNAPLSERQQPDNEPLPTCQQKGSTPLPTCQQSVNRLLTQDRLGKDSLGKDRIEKDSTGKAGTEQCAEEAGRKKRFRPPSVEEVAAYCAERGGRVDAHAWYDFYLSKDWKIGRSAMKDWRASVRTWERNGVQSHPGRAAPLRERSHDLDEVF